MEKRIPRIFSLLAEDGGITPGRLTGIITICLECGSRPKLDRSLPSKEPSF